MKMYLSIEMHLSWNVGSWDICDEWTALEFDVLMIKSQIIPGEFLRMGHSCHPLLSAFSGHSNGDTQQESQTSQRFDPESVQ